MTTEQATRSATPEVAVAVALDEYRRRVVRFMDHQQRLRQESAQGRARALHEGRVGEASLLDQLDECLAETVMQLSVLASRLASAREL